MRGLNVMDRERVEQRYTVGQVSEPLAYLYLTLTFSVNRHLSGVS